jgi:2-haloacid dehalogenase
MTITLAFDVYGTLINTSGVNDLLKQYIDDKTELFMELWRSKQLEYSFRRGLMKRYEKFSVCTRNALDYSDAYLNTGLTEDQKKSLMQKYRVLPAFSDVKESLIKLKTSNCRMFAFSNGFGEDIKNLLKNAGLEKYFEGVISVDDIKTFKPNPDVYAHFLSTTGSTAAESWLISGNPFDVIGAGSVGMNSVWVQRNPKTVFDPWEIEPTVTITCLPDLYDSLSVKT